MISFPEIHISVCDEGHVHGSMAVVDTDAPDDATLVDKTFDTVEQALEQTLKFINSHKAQHH